MWTVLILFVVGTALIIAEFMVPGAVLGILGFISLMGSITYAWMNVPEYALLITVTEVIALVGCLLLGMYLLTRTGRWNPFIMHETQRIEEGYVSPHAEDDIIGQIGVSHTALRPAGTVLLNGQRISAVSSGVLIPKDRKVKIVEIDGPRVVVEEVPANDSPAPSGNRP